MDWGGAVPDHCNFHVDQSLSTPTRSCPLKMFWLQFLKDLEILCQARPPMCLILCLPGVIARDEISFSYLHSGTNQMLKVWDETHHY